MVENRGNICNDHLKFGIFLDFVNEIFSLRTCVLDVVERESVSFLAQEHG